MEINCWDCKMENLMRLNTFDTRPRTWPESNESRKKQGKVKSEKIPQEERKKTPESGKCSPLNQPLQLLTWQRRLQGEKNHQNQQEQHR